MPRYKLDVGTLPRGGRVDAFWYRTGAPRARLGSFYTPTFEVTVPNIGALNFEVVPRDSSGRRGPSRRTSVNTFTDKPERTAAKDLTVPDPDVRLEDGTLKIKPKKPVATDPKAIDYEVRVSEPEEDEAAAVFVGEIPAETEVRYNSWPVDNMDVHVRPRYNDTNEPGTWTTRRVHTATTPPDHVQVEDDAGTSATGWSFQTMYGYTPLEFASSTWRNAEVPAIWNTTNTDSIWGMSGESPMWALRDYFPEGEVLSPATSVGTLHEFLPVLHPEFSAVATTSRPIWDTQGDKTPWLGGRDEPSVTADFREGQFDRRKRLQDFAIFNSADNGHRGPVEIEHEIDVDESGGGLAGTYEGVVHGHRYRGYDVRHKIRLRSRWGTRRISLSKLRLIRWIRNKKWEYKVALSGNITADEFTYTFSPAPEIVGTPVATVTVLDESLTAAHNYVTTIQSLSATAITVSIFDVDTGTPSFANPGTTDTYLYIVLTGY